MQELLGDIHQDIRFATAWFDMHYNALIAPAQAPIDLEGMWVVFINMWAQRIANRHRNYAVDRLNTPAAPWEALVANPQSARALRIAQENLRKIYSLRTEIRRIVFDRSRLT